MYIYRHTALYATQENATELISNGLELQHQQGHSIYATNLSTEELMVKLSTHYQPKLKPSSLHTDQLH